MVHLYLLNEFAIPSQSSWGSRMRDICLNLDRLDGILIEIVVEEREPGIADVRYSGIGVAVKLRWRWETF